MEIQTGPNSSKAPEGVFINLESAGVSFRPYYYHPQEHSEMTFNSIQELSLHVSPSISRKIFRNSIFRFRISITISCLWIHLLLQLISSAFQRCRVSEDLCRLSIILRFSPASDPLIVQISSKFSHLCFEFSFSFFFVDRTFPLLNRNCCWI